MTKQELKRDLIAANGGRPMMSKRRIRMIIGIGEDTMNEMLASTDYKVIGKNHAKMYYAGDVAEAYLKM